MGGKISPGLRRRVSGVGGCRRFVLVLEYGYASTYHEYMQLRYSYRLYPEGPQREALARALGCARVVFNEALAALRTRAGSRILRMRNCRGG